MICLMQREAPLTDIVRTPPYYRDADFDVAELMLNYFIT